MHRLPTMPLDRPIPASGEREDTEFSSDDAALSHLKLGTAWLCTTLAGVAGLAYSSISQTSPPATMLVLVVLLVAYGGYGFSLPKKNTVQFADSFYYMGFLWAIFGLISAFVLWPGPKLTTDAVLTTFGYALVTTFCGMLFRLVIIQFQDTHPDRLVHAQEAIDHRMAALVHQIDEATMEISSFRDRAASDLDGTLHDLVRSLAEVREKIAEQHRTMAHVLSEGLESSLHDLLTRLSAIHIPQEMLTAEVTKLITALGKQGQGLEQAAHRLETSLTHAAQTAMAFGESLTGSGAAKEVGVAINDLFLKIKDRTEQFSEMTAALERSRSELNGQLNSLQSLRSAVSTVSAQLSAFETELKDVSSASMAAEVRTGLTNVQHAISSSLEASQAIESTMRGMLFFMKERVTEEHSGARR
jgi:predicted  nucleic acid-binding Zn-ribbon protein